MIAAQILGRSYGPLKEEHDAGPQADCRAKYGGCSCAYCIIDNARQTGKVGNFGLAGGLGAKALVAFALATYDVRLTEDEARGLKRVWFITWPEMPDYFRYIDSTVQSGRPLQQLFSGRYRGDPKYTARCNTLFQGLAADMAKDAGWRICYACYVDTASPLFGCRIVNFVHDEFIVEVPEHRAHEAAMELSRLMTEAAKHWLPDVTCKAKPVLMPRWMKGAKQVWQNNRLVPCAA
jgi:DNA polymerase I-like protein with 3'-5' exonuclease and polymerase domains